MRLPKRALAGITAVLALSLAACGGTPTASHPAHATPTVQAGALRQLNALKPTLHGGRYRAPGFGAPPVGNSSLRRRNATSSSAIVHGYDTAGSDYKYIPLGASVAGCYVGGTWADNCSGVTSRQVQHIFSIATSPGQVARVYDDEPGNGLPGNAGPWLKMVLSNGVKRPGIYADGAWMPAVEASAAAYGIPHCTTSTQTYCYLRWLAAWDNSPFIEAGMDAHQYASSSVLDYDVFNEQAWFPSVAPPTPKPVQHYLRFCHNPADGGLFCGPYDVPLGKGDRETNGHDFNNERSALRLYDTARAKSQTGKRLQYVNELRDELHGLAIHRASVARSSSAAYDTRYFEWGRVDCLMARALDYQVKSWNQCTTLGHQHNWTRYLK